MNEPQCTYCSMPILSGEEGCRAIFKETLKKCYLMKLPHIYLQALIGSYSLQHPEPYLKEPKSTADFLTVLYYFLHHEQDEDLLRARRIWIDSAFSLEYANPPEFKGALHINHVSVITEEQEIKKRMKEYAGSVITAYQMHNDKIERWCDMVSKVRGT